jgi:Transcriptional regulator/sugar kinase
MQLFAGIEIGGTKLQLVTGDENGKILERQKLAVETGKGAPGIRQQIEKTLPALLAGRKPVAIGVGFGGPVDWSTGKICRSHQIEGWSEFDLGGWLQQLAGAPVFVDNDANVAALGEARHGAGIASNPVFYVTLGSGVGGGLVADGKIYHGSVPGEAEIGHIRLNRSGTTVESRCSGWAVDARIREFVKKEPASLLARKVGNAARGEARYLAAALLDGDLAAKKILHETAEDLAFGLSHVVHLFHPAIIIIGGGLSGLGEPFRSAVQNALGQFVMEAFAPGPMIKLAKLGEDAVPVGALELARDRLAE